MTIQMAANVNIIVNQKLYPFNLQPKAINIPFRKISTKSQTFQPFTRL